MSSNIEADRQPNRFTVGMTVAAGYIQTDVIHKPVVAEDMRLHDGYRSCWRTADLSSLEVDQPYLGVQGFTTMQRDREHGLGHFDREDVSLAQSAKQIKDGQCRASNHAIELDGSDRRSNQNNLDFLMEFPECPRHPVKPSSERSRRPFKRHLRSHSCKAPTEGRRRGSNHVVDLTAGVRDDYDVDAMLSEFPECPRRPFQRRVHPEATAVGSHASLRRYIRIMRGRFQTAVPSDASHEIPSEDR